MKLLVDMNLSPLWVQFLNENGLEAHPLVGSERDERTRQRDYGARESNSIRYFDS